MNNNQIYLFHKYYKTYGNLFKECDEVSKYCFMKIFDKDEATSMDLTKFQAIASNIIASITLNEDELNFLIPPTKCIECGLKVVLEKNFKMVTCYTEKGTQLGRRYKSRCRRCNITYHPTFVQKNGKRFLQMDSFLQNEWILSTEDTAFSKKFLKNYEWELVITNTSFRAKCEIFNSIHDYTMSTDKIHKRKR